MSDTIKFPLAALEQPCNEIDASASDEIKRLERERDEAKAWAEKLQTVAMQHSIRAENAERERDEAREELKQLKEKYGREG